MPSQAVMFYSSPHACPLCNKATGGRGPSRPSCLRPQRAMKAANLTEYGGFDYTYTFGLAEGARQTAALGAPLLNVIGQYVYHSVGEVRFRSPAPPPPPPLSPRVLCW